MHVYTSEEVGHGYITTNQPFKIKNMAPLLYYDECATLLLTYHDRASVAFGERKHMSLIYTFARSNPNNPWILVW